MNNYYKIKLRCANCNFKWDKEIEKGKQLDITVREHLLGIRCLNCKCEVVVKDFWKD